ncbi:MAG TPA: hypothetical protein VGP47_08930, partial [Parachlamydiaceae bacterium]|nr:hypothetical protein [Parachlamydiaceae bacterium]
SLLGLLFPDDIVNIFCIKNLEGDTPLHYGMQLEMSIPFLEKLPSKDVRKVVTCQNNNEDTPLHYGKKLKKIIPLLKKLTMNDVVIIYSITNSDGETLLHHNEDEIRAVHLIKDFPSEIIAKLLCQKNHEDRTPLHNKHTLKNAIHLFKKLRTNQISNIFSHKDMDGKTPLDIASKLIYKDLVKLFSVVDIEGNTLLHNRAILKKSFPLLDALSPVDLDNVLSIVNLEEIRPRQILFDLGLAFPLLNKVLYEKLNRWITPRLTHTETDKKDAEEKEQLNLFNKRKLEKSVASYEKMDSFSLVKLLCATNPKGNSVVHYYDLIKVSFPLLLKLLPSHLVEVLTKANKDGHTPVHYIDIFELILPLLETLETNDQIVKVFSPLNCDGATPLDYPEILEIALPFIEKRDSILIAKLLSIANHKGDTLIHDPTHIPLPLLAKLNPFSLLSLLTQKNNDGNTPLHSARVFDLTFPLLENLKNSDNLFFVKFLSSKNNNGNIPLHTLETFQRTYPLLKDLDKNVIMYLVSITNDKGLTPMQLYQDTNEGLLLDNILKATFTEQKILQNSSLANVEMSKSYEHDIQTIKSSAAELFDQHLDPHPT